MTTEPDDRSPKPDEVGADEDDEARTGEEQAAVNRENDPPA